MGKQSRNGRGNIGAALGVAVLVMASAVVRGRFPAVFWLLPITVLMAALWADLLSISAHHRRVLLVWGAVGAGLQLVVCMARAPYTPSFDYGWLDDAAYFKESAFISEFWARGWYPNIGAKGNALPYLGTLHTGYHRWLSALFFVAGPSVSVGLLLNCACAFVAPLVASFAAKDLTTERDANVLPPAAMWAAPLLALHPNTSYFGAFLMKDVLTATFCLAALRYSAGVIIGSGSRQLVCLAIALAWLFILRAYTCPAVMAGTLLVIAARVERGIGLQTLVFGSLGALAIGYTRRGAPIIDQLLESLARTMPTDLDSTPRVIKHVVYGVIRLLFGPFPWVHARGDWPNYEAYFGQWYMFLVAYPFAGLALVTAFRKNRVVAAMPAFMAMAGGAVLLLNYGGSVARQRLFIDYWVLVLAALALPPAKGQRLWVLVTYLGIAIFAAMQLTRLSSAP